MRKQVLKLHFYLIGRNKLQDVTSCSLADIYGPFEERIFVDRRQYLPPKSQTTGYRLQDATFQKTTLIVTVVTDSGVLHNTTANHILTFLGPS
jgi:hypothetical protein